MHLDAHTQITSYLVHGTSYMAPRTWYLVVKVVIYTTHAARCTYVLVATSCLLATVHSLRLPSQMILEARHGESRESVCAGGVKIAKIANRTPTTGTTNL